MNGLTDISGLAQEWTRLLAPRTGDVRRELVREAAEFLGISELEAWRRMEGAGERFNEEWRRTVTSGADAETLTQFYNQSDTELFELIEWHASDPIHYRSLVVRDYFDSPLRRRRQSGRRYLDYGSGIGNDALVFAHAGFDITLADVSDCLLAFAAWRCRRRGFPVRTIDLKREVPPTAAFDLIVCFDVLEHIPKPLNVVRGIRCALREDGLLVVHAPFGEDPTHPMHVVHRDVITPRMRSLGFQPVDCWFPPAIRAPHVYERREIPAIERAGYFVYDNYLNNPLGERLAVLYRSVRRRNGPDFADTVRDRLFMTREEKTFHVCRQVAERGEEK